MRSTRATVRRKLHLAICAGALKIAAVRHDRSPRPRAGPREIVLPTGLVIPILYEDRGVLAIDKPAGWMLAPDSWTQTSRNLQLALASSMNAGDFWARKRNLKFIRFIHRLDAETSGVLLLARNPGVLTALSQLFETREVTKKYFAVVHGAPPSPEWTCDLPIGEETAARGRMKVDRETGRDARTIFRVRETRGPLTLIQAEPETGRTHQIRVHLQAAGCSVVGDSLYASRLFPGGTNDALALRAMSVRYLDPFLQQKVSVAAPAEEFLARFGFAGSTVRVND